MTQESVDKYGLGGNASNYERLGDNNVMGKVSEKFTGENILERENIKIGNSEQFMLAKGYVHINEKSIREIVFTQKGMFMDENIPTSHSFEQVLSEKTRYVKPENFYIEQELEKTINNTTFQSSEERYLIRQKNLNSRYLLHGVKPVRQDTSVIQYIFKEIGKFMSDSYIYSIKYK